MKQVNAKQGTVTLSQDIFECQQKIANTMMTHCKDMDPALLENIVCGINQEVARAFQLGIIEMLRGTDGLVIISTTHEMEHGEWVYRLIEDKKGILIRRTLKENMLWGHGVLTQMLDESGKFMMGISVSKPKFLKTIEEAVQLIKEQK